MKMKHLYILLFALAFVCRSEETARKFSLQECIDYAMKHSPTLAKQEISVKNQKLQTVIEEAHNVLRNPEGAGGGDAKRVVADMFGNMLSEIRSYGEGLMILDQVPTRLIPDVVKNTNYKIAHRMSSPDDCAVMESALALRGDQRGILPTLGQGEVIVLGDHDDAASWVKVEKGNNDYADPTVH